MEYTDCSFSSSDEDALEFLQSRKEVIEKKIKEQSKTKVYTMYLLGFIRLFLNSFFMLIYIFFSFFIKNLKKFIENISN